MKIVFNELSIADLSLSETKAITAMNVFLESASELSKRIGKKIDIVSNQSLTNIELANGFNIAKWIWCLDPDDRKRFLGYCTSAPFIINYPVYLYEGKETAGFAYACENDLLAISYNPKGDWSKTEYLLKRQYIDDDTEDVAEEEAKVCQFADKVHLDSLSVWITNKVEELNLLSIASLKDFEDFWEKRELLFDKLIFCDSIRVHLNGISINDPVFKKALVRLIKLNSYLQKSSDEVFDFSKLGFDISGESTSTLEKYSDERTFLCPDGRKRVFEHHFKMGSSRIHFYHETAIKKAYIGYIGGHLRTSRYSS